MTKVADMARITEQRRRPPRKVIEDLPDISTLANLEEAAALVHWEMLERAQRHGRQEARDGVPGWVWDGTRIAIYHYLWPGLKKDDGSKRHKGKGDQLTTGDIIEKRISTFLNAKGNTVCLIHGGPKNPSTWWIRAEFSTGAPTASDIRRYHAMEPTWTEKRLTEHEAGEDREPEPVKVTHQPWHKPGTSQPASKELVFRNLEDGRLWRAVQDGSGNWIASPVSPV